MGLAKWWLARRRTEAATSTSNEKRPPSPKTTAATTTVPRRGRFGLHMLRRSSAPQEPRKAQLQAVTTTVDRHVQSTEDEPDAEETTMHSPNTLSCLHLSRHRLHAGVSQAKDLLQQCVSLYPSLVQLTVPRAPVDAKDPLSVATPSVSPVTESSSTTSLRTPTPSWVPSPVLVQFERDLAALVAEDVLELRMTAEGCGGAYFVEDTRAKASASSSSSSSSSVVAIFKPREEEYMAPKNPRGYVKEGAIVGVTEHPVNKGFRVGNGALRERAAFLLDDAYGNFSGVPVTSLVVLPTTNGVQEGSVQAFVPSECSAEDMGSLRFSVPEVHKIGILDVRLFNTDRHAGNILLDPRGPNDQTYTMTPIDHGFCLPSYRHLDNANFDWLQWPQAQYPFTSEALDHIGALDVARDAAILRSLGIEEECITTMRICTTLLKVGADAGYSLFDIGSCLQREGDFSEPSPLETVVASAMDAARLSVQGCGDEESVQFMEAVVGEVESRLSAMLVEQPKKKVRCISCFT